MTHILIGVIGPGETASEAEMQTAHALGEAIAQAGWGLLTGGRAAGVMAAASQGAQAANGLVVGILPDADVTQAAAVDIAIVTGMGQGRNVINILSSRVVIACGLGPGTLSEMALALKLGKPLIVLQPSGCLLETLSDLSSTPLVPVATIAEAIAATRRYLAE
ncbi:SLOG cluster 4 domain-containing protein [Leptolyngbya iicbica]|uniref:Cytochrome n=2 Tax=Cyanophyceae TaxID=3028117 RepID=A0A4Q7E6A0_9CYAN|nr:LOG family protein [Leptolyngbya sp. LK]RZM77987.1 cytochrome [Leptolyngbya sp. LK]